MDLDNFFIINKIDAYAIGDVETIKAPKGFHPKDIFPESKSIIIFGKVINGEVFKLESKVKSFSLYKLIHEMDKVSIELCELLNVDGFFSIPIPTFFPSKINGGTIKGILSLKHCAKAVGLGSIGENTLLISKKYGNKLCLSAVLTTKKYDYKENIETEDLCLKCNMCINICSTHAITNRKVDVTKCKNFTYSVPKFLMPIIRFLIKLKWFEKYIEIMVNILGWNSDMVCSDCLTVCPHFRIYSSYNKANSADTKSRAAD